MNYKGVKITIMLASGIKHSPILSYLLVRGVRADFPGGQGDVPAAVLRHEWQGDVAQARGEGS